jgi:hypothetical protein
LILNPSLEEYDSCPNYMSLIDYATHWTQPLTFNSTTDYFNACSDDTIIMSFIVGHNIYFGNGFGGIISVAPEVPTYREYAQGSLSVPLTEGKCYHCEFWVKPMNRGFGGVNFNAIDDIGVFFSDTLPYSDSMQPFSSS